MRRTVAALVLTMSLMLTAVPAGADSAARDAAVAVDTARMLYVDGYDNASFTAEGCVPATDVVVPTSDACSPSSGTLRGALLGFDAAHHVEVGVADVPGVQVSASGVQQVSLLLDVLSGIADAVVVVSNDSDLAFPVRAVRDRVPVGLINPRQGYTAGDLKGSKTDGVGNHWWWRLNQQLYRHNQLPDPAGKFTKPTGW